MWGNRKKRSCLGGVLLLTLLLCGCADRTASSDAGENPYLCVKQTEQDGSYTAYEYDSSGEKTKETRYSADGSLQGWTEYQYDENGNLLEVDAVTDGAAVPQTQYEYLTLSEYRRQQS